MKLVPGTARSDLLFVCRGAAGIRAYFPRWRESKAGRGPCWRPLGREHWRLEGGMAPRPVYTAWSEGVGLEGTEAQKRSPQIRAARRWESSPSRGVGAPFFCL